MAWAARATRRRKGNITRVMRTASSNLPGVAWKPGARRPTSPGANRTPRAQKTPTTTMMALATRFEAGGFLAAAGGERLGEGGDEGRGQGAFGKQVAGEVGDAEAEQKGVVDEAGAEDAGEDDFAEQAGDAAGENGERDDARRAHDIIGRRRVLEAGNLGRNGQNRLPQTWAGDGYRPYSSKNWAMVMMPV